MLGSLGEGEGEEGLEDIQDDNMRRYRIESGHEVEKGKYSMHRTERGNILVGRRHGKSKLEVIRNMISLQNLHTRHRAARKWEGTEKKEAESVARSA
jgi:hypothetical protein